MKLTIEIDEDEIMESAKQMIIKDIAEKMLSQYRSSAEKNCYRKVIKECVREVIKGDIDNLSERAVQAASVSITNKTLKNMSTEELMARIVG